MKPLMQQWPDDLAAHYRARGYWTGETFGEVIERVARDHAGRTAVVCQARRWTYAELLERADRTAAAFRAAGLEPGARVVVQMPTGPSSSRSCSACSAPG